METLPLSFAVLLNYLCVAVQQIADPRQSSNATRYKLGDVIWARFRCSSCNVSRFSNICGRCKINAAKTTPKVCLGLPRSRTIDLDDIEVEIQKPEKERNLPELKKRLLAAIAAGTLVTAPIAGMTDFTNNVLEIGQKVGIELKLPPVK